MFAELDGFLAEVGYVRSSRLYSEEGRWHRHWHISEPDGRRENGFVSVTYYANPEKHGSACNMHVNVNAGEWQPHGEIEWRTFFLLRDGVLPALAPNTTVRVLDHPATRTRTWDVPSLAARFSPGEALPQAVQARIDAHERRWPVAQWAERTAVAMGAAMSTWQPSGVGRLRYSVGMYFLFPPNWIVFAAFVLATVVGNKLIPSCRWRTAGLVTLAVILLMPVKTPTLVGTFYMPHGFIQLFDFDPRYYVRELGFTVTSAACTAALAWSLMRLLRRSPSTRPKELAHRKH